MSDYSFLSTSRFIKSAADELPSQSDKPIISRFYVFLSKKWKSTLFQLNLTISHGKVKKLRRLIQPTEHSNYSAFFLVSANAPIETTNAAIATAIPLPSPVLGESEGFAFVVVAVVVVVVVVVVDVVVGFVVVGLVVLGLVVVALVDVPGSITQDTDESTIAKVRMRSKSFFINYTLIYMVNYRRNYFCIFKRC